MPSPSELNANMNNDNGKQSLRNSELLNAESNHLKSIIKERDKLLKSKENSILKHIAEIEQLKKQLATNRSYTIIIEQKHKDLQHSLKVATERIEQIEHDTQDRGSNNINPPTQQKQSAPQSEINEMKVWVLQQKFRQLELDLHKNNIELMMLKNQQNSDNLNEGTTKGRNRKRRKPHFRGGNTNEPKPAQINIAQQMDEYLMYEQRTDESTPVESAIQHDESFFRTCLPDQGPIKRNNFTCSSETPPQHKENLEQQPQSETANLQQTPTGSESKQQFEHNSIFENHKDTQNTTTDQHSTRSIDHNNISIANEDGEGLANSENVENLKLITFNIEGMNSNMLDLERLANRADAICIQEHWLHHYEKHALDKLLPDFICFTKCHDDDQKH